MSESRNPTEAHTDPTRRRINALIGLGFVSTITGFFGSILAYLWPATGAGGSEFLIGEQGPVHATDIAVDGSVVGRSRLGKILVVRRQQDLIGLQATCTHLGCTVAWNVASGEVECPCHGARYNLHGEVLGGPVRQGLEPVSLTVEEGGIRVRPIEG